MPVSFNEKDIENLVSKLTEWGKGLSGAERAVLDHIIENGRALSDSQLDKISGGPIRITDDPGRKVR
jgi:hypothetical protein